MESALTSERNSVAGTPAIGTGETTTVDTVGSVLGRILKDGIDIHRCMAARALGRIADPVTLGALIAALKDEDEDVRMDAAGALARIGDARSREALHWSLINDPCAEVKLAAMDTLAQFGADDLIPLLRRLVQGRADDVAWDEEAFYDGGWDDWTDIQVKAIQALALLGAEEAVPEIVSAIDDEFGQELTDVGFKVLAGLGEPGVKALTNFLDDKSERRRRRVAAALGGVDAELADAALARALADPSKDVRLMASRSLARHDPADGRLAALFDDADPEVRAEAARICGVRYPQKIDTLLNDPDTGVQTVVLGVLAEEPETLAADVVADRIRLRLHGADEKVAAAATAALAALDPAGAFDDLSAAAGDGKRPLEVRLAALRGLATIGGDDVERVLAELAGDDQRQVRLDALSALAARAGGDNPWPNFSGDTLLAALGGDLVPAPETADDDDEPRAEPVSSEPEDKPAAASADGAEDEEPTGDDEAFPLSTLQSMLGADAAGAEINQKREEGIELTGDDMERLALAQRSPKKKAVPVVPTVAAHDDVRRFAARLLGDLRHDVVAEALAGVLADEDREVRLAAVDSLARIGEGPASLPVVAVEALFEAAGHVEPEMRLLAVRALGKAGGDGVAEVVAARLADDDGFVRAEAVGALSELGAGGDSVVALFDDPEPGVRLATARAVAVVGSSGTLDQLVDFAFAFKGYHRREAGRILRGVDAEAANARFVDVLNDTDQMSSWQVAIEALEELNASVAGIPGQTEAVSAREIGDATS